MTQNLVAAAAYIRMSTDKQEDSPKRQRREIEILAARDGFNIVEWYEDHGKSGTSSKKRLDFLRMMEDAKHGKFRAVLVHEHSRFSREGMFEAFAHFKLLNQYGVTLVSSRRGALKFDDLAGMITTMIDQHGARTESIKIADRTVSGKLAKAEAGIRHGRAPYGYERKIYDEKKCFVRTVGLRDKFQIPRGWHSELVPSSNQLEVEAVRYMFQAMASGSSEAAICREINSRGLKTHNDLPFDFGSVRRIIANPVYAGIFRLGHQSSGQFVTIEPGKIFIPNNHPALVDEKLFHEANKSYNARKRKRGQINTGDYLLSGLIFCTHCDRAMYGTKFHSGKTLCYRCHEVNGRCGLNRCAVSPITRIGHLEEIIIGVIRDEILSDDVVFREVIHLASRDMEEIEPSFDDDRIASLERKIAKATENLALANDEKEFGSISTLLKKWRSELSVLIEQRANRTTTHSLSKSEVQMLQNKELIKANLMLAPRKMWVETIRQIISRIDLQLQVVDNNGNSEKHFSGEIFFVPEIGFEDAIPFSYIECSAVKSAKAIAGFLKLQTAPLTVMELAREFNLALSTMYYHIQKATKANLVTQLPQRRELQRLYVASSNTN